MQEEVKNRTVNLVISTIKPTARITPRLALWGIRKVKESEAKTEAERNLPLRDKQTIWELAGQNQGVTNIDITGTDLKGFEKHAREFGVDYAIIRDRLANPSKHLVFFKVQDADAMAAAFNAYSTEVFMKGKHPSVLKILHKLMNAIRDILVKAVSRDR